MIRITIGAKKSNVRAVNTGGDTSTKWFDLMNAGSFCGIFISCGESLNVKSQPKWSAIRAGRPNNCLSTKWSRRAAESTQQWWKLHRDRITVSRFPSSSFTSIMPPWLFNDLERP